MKKFQFLTIFAVFRPIRYANLNQMSSFWALWSCFLVLKTTRVLLVWSEKNRFWPPPSAPPYKRGEDKLSVHFTAAQRALANLSVTRRCSVQPLFFFTLTWKSLFRCVSLLYKRVCSSVRLSIGRSARHTRVELLRNGVFVLNLNRIKSIRDLKLGHLKDKQRQVHERITRSHRNSVNFFFCFCKCKTS